MQIDKNKVRKNVDYAKKWLNRANKDFTLFKKLVPFDNKTTKPVRCSDPALAVYLLQQCVEKAVKAAVIASGQYKVKDYIQYYSHNSLALMINLNTKIVAKIKALGLDSVTGLMGIDLVEGKSKMTKLENQALGKIPLVSKEGKEESFVSECIRLTPEIIDKLLDSNISIRRKILDMIKTTFSVLQGMGINKDYGKINDSSEFIKTLSERISDILKTSQLSEGQRKAPIEFLDIMSGFGLQTDDNISRKNMTANYLSVWAFSYSLLWLTYITFAHESTSRYPLERKGNVLTGNIGCDDYNQSLGIVNRIGQIGYATSLTLSEMKTEIESIAHFFAADWS